MFLTLDIVRGNLQTIGGLRRKVFSTDGGRIGRSRDCEMLLVSAGVHRHHATIEFLQGVFYLEGVGRNGLSVNGVTGSYMRGSRHPLKTGDRLMIDEYELMVTVSETSPGDSPPCA